MFPSHDRWRLEWNIENIFNGSSIVKTNIRGLKYPEYFPGNVETHNPYKLAKGDGTITIAFESEAPSATSAFSFYGSSNNEESPYDPSLNDCKLFDNGVTVMDFDINDSTSIGNSTRDPKVSYYHKYTELTYLGINADNGIETAIRNYDVTSGDCQNFQFFGNPGTSATFSINNDLIVTCFNTSGGLFGLDFGLGAPTWQSSFATTNTWETLSGPDISADSWIASSNEQKIFTFPGEFYPPLSSPTLLSGYSATYHGSGCHLFEICLSG